MRRMRGGLLGGAVIALLCAPACKPLIALDQMAGRADLSSQDLGRELVRMDPGPPPAEPGLCWQGDITPAVIETVTEQVLTSPGVTGADGTVIRPATYRTDTRQRIAQEREVVWFRAPCDAELTVDFVASLQRALKARGYFGGPPTGRMDAITAEAVRRYQAERGLDSPRLSLGAARQLGLSIIPVNEL